MKRGFVRLQASGISNNSFRLRAKSLPGIASYFLEGHCGR